MAVEYGIITSVVPPQGWHYPQQISDGQTVRITGFSFEMLLDAMLDFRRRHPELCGGMANATIERVRADLKDYLCTHFRQNCADSPTSPTITSGSGIGITKRYHSPIDKAASWLADIEGGNWLAQVGHHRLEKVDAALAAHRAQICASCPQNVRWATPCAPCNDSILVRIQNAKGSLATPYDRNLQVCRIYGHTNEVAVWLADTHSSSEQQPPPICWHNE
jgi:hypothetical protein